MNKRTYPLFLICLLIMPFIKVAAQQIYPQGSSIISSVKELEGDLAAKKWDKAHMSLFKGAYDMSIPDMICYVDSTSHCVDIGISHNKKDTSETVLWGEKAIWVIVVVDKKLMRPAPKKANDKASKKTPGPVIQTTTIKAFPKGTKIMCFDSLKIETAKMDTSNAGDSLTFTVKRETVQYQPGPSENSLSGIINSVISVITGKSISSGNPTSLVKDSTLTLKLDPWYDSKGDSIYVGVMQFNIPVNAKNRIIIIPNGEAQAKTKKQFNSAACNFGNYDYSFFGISLGVGFTFQGGGNKDSTHNNNSWDKTSVANLYVLFYRYLIRPQLPVRKYSLGIVAGTNILYGGHFFNEIFSGLRLGWGNVGVIAGWTGAYDIDKAYREKVMIGLDYKL